MEQNNKILKKIGYVIKVYDGIAIIKGLEDVEFNEIIKFSNNIRGIVFNIEKYNVGAVILGNEKYINTGEKVKRTYNILKIKVGFNLLGRVINTLGKPLDGKNIINAKIKKNIDTESPSIIDRESIKNPMNTGIKIIDSLIPIGQGQRELIIGDRKIGKTSIVIDTILNQKNINNDIDNKKDKTYCIYVNIGQKQCATAKIIKQLKKTGAIKYSIIVIASAASPVSLQFYAPYIGCTIAEFFRDNGMHSIVIYDDLSKHAIAYRQMSLLLKRSPGREAYPGDIFYIHSKLLERAAKLNRKLGGGSLTALPIIETQNGDISSYIATNVISITDGQIFLEADLFRKGIKPAINIGLSVSRIGSAAQTEIIKKISSKIKLELAQYREMESFAQFGTDLDENTINLLNKGKKITYMFNQDVNNPLLIDEQIINLFAATRGFLSNVKDADVNKFLKKAYRELKYKNKKLINDIKIKKKLTIKIENELMMYFEKLKYKI